MTNTHSEKSNAPATGVQPVAVEYFIRPEEERKVLWKIDRVVMPAMMIVLFFQCKTPLIIGNAIGEGQLIANAI